LTIHQWTHQGTYLHAVMRGEMRRNLDGSEAGALATIRRRLSAIGKMHRTVDCVRHLGIDGTR
jgi:hypothetical protein